MGSEERVDRLAEVNIKFDIPYGTEDRQKWQRDRLCELLRGFASHIEVREDWYTYPNPMKLVVEMHTWKLNRMLFLRIERVDDDDKG